MPLSSYRGVNNQQKSDAWLLILIPYLERTENKLIFQPILVVKRDEHLRRDGSQSGVGMEIVPDSSFRIVWENVLEFPIRTLTSIGKTAEDIVLEMGQLGCKFVDELSLFHFEIVVSLVPEICDGEDRIGAF